MATSLSILACPLGMAIGYALPFTHLSPQHPYQDSETNGRKESLGKAATTWAIVFILLLALCTAVHIKAPPRPRA
jgi:hypothetical protein